MNPNENTHRQQNSAKDNFLSVRGKLIQFGSVINVAVAVITIFCLIARVIVQFETVRCSPCMQSSKMTSVRIATLAQLPLTTRR